MCHIQLIWHWGFPSLLDSMPCICWRNWVICPKEYPTCWIWMTVFLWCHLPHSSIPWIFYQVYQAIVGSTDLIKFRVNFGGHKVLWISFCIMSWDTRCLNTIPLLAMLKLTTNCSDCKPDLSFIKFLINVWANIFNGHW